MPRVVDQNTRVPLSVLTAVVTAALGIAFYIWTIRAEAAAAHDRIDKLEAIVESIPDMKSKLAAMDYKLDFLVSTFDGSRERRKNEANDIPANRGR